ncbi:hypothetical protein BgAZ_100820 [Babesia gibsoni]|uniref:Uncharacterized protein n=1 Tax=Babesia gibsoni TaxID=33632 RepID=A0AAD8USJ9_BABGI|nr:hypothetical protein BgAZ_100820 [Babesia gibsoni]
MLNNSRRCRESDVHDCMYEEQIITKRMKKATLYVLGLVDVAIHPTDPYLHGCGMTDPSEELFRDNTAPLLNDAGERIGCEVDLALGDASFYCPLPYHTEPPNCMPRAPTWSFRVIKPGGAGNKHMFVFTKGALRRWFNRCWKQMKQETFECHCTTYKGIRMATIRVHA